MNKFHVFLGYISIVPSLRGAQIPTETTEETRRSYKKKINKLAKRLFISFM